MGVPPIYGQRDLGDVGGYHANRDSAEGVHLNQREQALDAKAEYWREKFRALERAVHSRSGVEDHAGPTITMLESKIHFLESELDQARRAALPGGGDDRASRLDGQVKVLRMQVENLEEARLREESRRIETEEELRDIHRSGKAATKWR